LVSVCEHVRDGEPAVTVVAPPPTLSLGGALLVLCARDIWEHTGDSLKPMERAECARILPTFSKLPELQPGDMAEWHGNHWGVQRNALDPTLLRKR